MPSPNRETRSTASALLIGTCDRLLFQLRDDIPGILYPGMIGLFGGHIETGETSLQAVRREIAEETGLTVADENLEPILSCMIQLSDYSNLNETVFIIKDVPSEQLLITEGRMLALSRSQTPQHLHRMTPATCCAARIILDQTH